MSILVSGTGGFIGSALFDFLKSQGENVTRLVRGATPAPRDIWWDPRVGSISPERMAGIDAVVHLAGASISSRRWTPTWKSEIRDTRIHTTRFLAEACAAMSHQPRVFVCASAVGFYGDRGDERLTEKSAAGKGFLADVCREWEQAAQPAREAGIRVVHLRLGMVLGTGGGALAKMLPAFRWGLGGRLGTGRQFMSWISIDDVVAAIHHVLYNDDIHGPVNIVSPNPVTNAEFTRALAEILRRPAVMGLPAPLLRILLGELADELLLSSTQALPAVLSDAGFTFQHADLRTALRQSIDRR